MIQRKDELLDLPLQERLDLAMQATWARVIDDHRRSGLPLVVMRNGRVVHLKPSPRPVEEWEEIDAKVHEKNITG